MRSGGFLGKKQQRNEPQKATRPPTSSDMRSLLASAQKTPDKPFTTTWQSPSQPNRHFTLTVRINLGAAQHDRRGWSSSAMDMNAMGDGEWRLTQEIDGKVTEIFAMKSSDADLILTLVEEAAGTAAVPSAVPEAAQPDGYQAPPPSNIFESANDPLSGAAPASSTSQRHAPPPPAPGSQTAMKYAAGNLRQYPVRTIIESYNQEKITGRLIVDLGTVATEVFFTDGEPVHAKSCHSIYQDRDTVGDAVIIDLLTWHEGDFKFNAGWPAASRTVTQPLAMFLSGEASASPAPSAPAPAAAAPAAPAANPAPAAQFASAAPPQSTGHAMSLDDFSSVDDLIGETYSNLVEKTGALKYGIFLMLARSEFVRFETGKQPFCVASIGLELQGRQLSGDMLLKIVECFEPVCQPLDILSFASPSRMYVLFPQSNVMSAHNTLRYFINTVSSTPFDASTPGMSIHVTAGLADVPRDGADFQQIFEHACKLRQHANAERRIVTSQG